MRLFTVNMFKFDCLARIGEEAEICCSGGKPTGSSFSNEWSFHVATMDLEVGTGQHSAIVEAFLRLAQDMKLVKIPCDLDSDSTNLIRAQFHE